MSWGFVDWDSVSSSKCCGVVPTIWKDAKWTCSECDKEVVYEEQLDLFGNDLGNSKHTQTKQCDCGGDKAMTTHAFWCSKGN